MKKIRKPSGQIPAVSSVPVETFYRISERLLLTTVRGNISASTVEDMIRQMRAELGKFPDERPTMWALDAINVTGFDAVNTRQPANDLFQLAKNSIGTHMLLIRSESDGASPTRVPLIMFARGLAFGVQLRLHAIATREEISSVIEQIRKEGGS